MLCSIARDTVMWHCSADTLFDSCQLRGVWQGCILSPLLFNLYINDLPFAFENTLSDPFVLPNGAKLNSLLYADDLIILSRSKTGLQNCLDKLSSFFSSWMMKINPKKTKIVVFQKRARKKCCFSLSLRLSQQYLEQILQFWEDARVIFILFSSWSSALSLAVGTKQGRSSLTSKN